MTSIPAGPGNTAQPAFCLTCNDLQRIAEQALVELAANPYLLCEEAAAKAMFAKAAMDHGLDVLNQDTNSKLLAIRKGNPGYELVGVERQGADKARIKQKNKDLLLSKCGMQGEADIQFKVHPGYGVKDLSTETQIGSLVLDLISLCGGQDRRSLKGPSKTVQSYGRVQAVVLVLANTKCQLDWLDGNRQVEVNVRLPKLIPDGIIDWVKNRTCDVNAGECKWKGWISDRFGEHWVRAPVPPPSGQKKTGEDRWVRLATGKNKEPMPLSMKCAAFKAKSSLDARVISPEGQGTHDICAFVWMRHDAQEGMS